MAFFTSLRIVLLILLLWTVGSPCWAQQMAVYTESSPPYQVLEESGAVSGEATQKVKAILAKAGLEAEFHLYPWARSMHLAKVNSRSLIYSIAKTPKREKYFVWLTPVAEFELALVALSERDDIVIESWSDLSKYSIAAQRDDVGFYWLEKQGMKEQEHFLACSDIECSWQYLLRGAVDLIIEDPALVQETARRMGVDESSIRTVRLIPDLAVTGYLAANRQMDPEILARLKQAVKSDDGLAEPQ